VAQALHYASWLDTATEDQIRVFAEEYLKKPLEDAFEEHFGKSLTAIVCQSHSVVLVAPKLDASAEAIVNYLAERHSVDINAVFFSYARVGQIEILARALLVPEQSAQRGAGGKRLPTIAELLKMAAEKKVSPLLEICRQMNQLWEERPSNAYGGSFRYWGEAPTGKLMVFGINIAEAYAKSSSGQLDVWIPTRTLAEVIGREDAAIRKVLNEKHSVFKSNQYDCVLRLETTVEAEALVSRLKTWSATLGGKALSAGTA
jgi:hypothetical protein